MGNEIQRVRILFKYAFDARLVDKPVHFGPTFKRPSRRVLRLARTQKGSRMLEEHELRAMIDAATMPLKAMILLGINTAFGNSDVGTLPIKALDLDDGWVNYPKPKTGVPRRCPLWPETVAAIQESLTSRPTPKDPADVGLVFITKYGGRWAKNSTDKPVAKETGKLLMALGFHRPGLGFYALRHTFATIGGEARDQAAVDHIMGHDRGDMASIYRERISDERLRAVTDHVRQWLFPHSATEQAEEDVGNQPQQP